MLLLQAFESETSPDISLMETSDEMSLLETTESETSLEMSITMEPSDKPPLSSQPVIFNSELKYL